MPHTKEDEHSRLLFKYLEGRAYIPHCLSPTVMNIAAKLHKQNQHKLGQPISLASVPRKCYFPFSKGEDLRNTQWYSTLYLFTKHTKEIKRNYTL
jgi:hypothetical protein